MWDLFLENAEIFGAFSSVLIIESIWLRVTLKRVKELEADNKDMSEKSIKIMTLATKALEQGTGADYKVKEALNNLTNELRLNSCKYPKDGG